MRLLPQKPIRRSRQRRTSPPEAGKSAESGQSASGGQERLTKTQSSILYHRLNAINIPRRWRFHFVFLFFLHSFCFLTFLFLSFLSFPVSVFHSDSWLPVF
jgi:hypothetical protein